MIHVIDDFYIKGGQLDFTLLRKTNSINKKTGEIIYKVLGYYSSVSNAVDKPLGGVSIATTDLIRISQAMIKEEPLSAL